MWRIRTNIELQEMANESNKNNETGSLAVIYELFMSKASGKRRVEKPRRMVEGRGEAFWKHGSEKT